MSKIRVLAGCSVRQDAHVLEAYVKSLRALVVDDDVQLDFAFVIDMEGHPDKEDAYQILAFTERLLEADKRDARAVYAVTERTHEWNHETFEHLARSKQRLLDYAREEGYDYFFLVDSDLLMGPRTLQTLLDCEVPVVSAVFWTQWQPDTPPMPQVWLRNPYDLSGLGLEQQEFMRMLVRRGLVRVIGGGACCLFDLERLGAGRYWPRMKNLPEHSMWQGEDRTMSITLQESRVKQYADAWPNVFHAYRPEQRTPEVLEEVLEALHAPQQTAIKYGDHVSFRVEPLQDPLLQQNLDPTARVVRGRFSALDLAPELEAALLKMSPGQSRLVQIQFPPWAKPVQYRGQSRIVQVTLDEIRPYGNAPVLADALFSGADDA